MTDASRPRRRSNDESTREHTTRVERELSDQLREVRELVQRIPSQLERTEERCHADVERMKVEVESHKERLHRLEEEATETKRRQTELMEANGEILREISVGVAETRAQVDGLKTGQQRQEESISTLFERDEKQRAERGALAWKLFFAAVGVATTLAAALFTASKIGGGATP